MATVPAKRIAIERDIELHFPDFKGFVTRVSANLSTSGMFIQTANPKTVGTEFSFSFLIDQWSPIRGEGRVVWVRLESEGPERPAGMGVQFLELDPESRRMIRWLVDKNLQEGGRPFDLRTVPAGASQTRIASLPATDAERRSANGRQAAQAQHAPVSMLVPTEPAPATSGRRIGIIVLFVLALALLSAIAYVGVAIWLDPERARPSSGPPAPTVADTPRTDSADPVSPKGAGEGEAVVDDAAMSREAAIKLVQGWSAAWTAQQPTEVLSFYVADFTPSGSVARPEWEARLRQQLDEATFIRIAVSALEVSVPEDGRASVTFFRSLRSDTVDEVRRMALDLEFTSAGWKIRRERFLD